MVSEAKGKLSRVVFILVLIGNFFYDHFTCFKLSEYEVSISYSHNASQIKLYTLSFSFVCLVEEAGGGGGGGGGGKLSRAVYLAPCLSIDR